jgi:Family of unknown function (DUF6498)
MRDLTRYKASVLALIATNFVPLFGVLFLSWDTFEIVGLYWIENVIIGAINVLKIATCFPNPSQLDPTKVANQEAVQRFRKRVRSAKPERQGSKLFFVPFFTIHYGIFCLAHGIFVLSFFAVESTGNGLFDGPRTFWQMMSERQLWWGVIALAASHLYSYAVNYLGRGEFRRTVVPALMIQPYARVVVLHLAIIFGAIVAGALGSNAGVLVLLVVGKTAIDLFLHLAERRRNEVRTSARSTGEILAEAPIDELARRN